MTFSACLFKGDSAQHDQILKAVPRPHSQRSEVGRAMQGNRAGLWQSRDLTHSHPEGSVGATGSCLKVAITPWNAFDQKARELNPRLTEPRLGMPDFPRGGCSLPCAEVGWAVGGERAQGPADGCSRGGEDSSGLTRFMHELRHRAMLSVMIRRNYACFPDCC